MVSGSRRISAAIAAAGVTLLASAATIALAQDAAPAPAPDAAAAPSAIGATAASLNLPANLQMFGKADPMIRKATAIVNGAIITDTDVEQRLALVVTANGGKVEGEELERLRLQVLRNLIDETLQIQEAAANKIEITPDEINQAYARVASNFQQSPTSFAEYLKKNGSSMASMKRQIEGELAWRRLLGRRVEPFVSVGQEEVQAVIDRLNASKGAEEYHVGEIFLSATPDRMAETLANAQQIVEQVRQGRSFVAYARQFSEASTAAVGGDLGWVRAEQLPDQLANAVRTIPAGAVSEPIAVPGGYSIIAVVDKRQVLMADPRDSTLSLKQLAIKFPAGSTQASATPRVEAFATAVKSISGCGQADEVAKTIGAEVVASDDIKVRDLPQQLQQVMLNLQVGQASQPFGSLEDGIRALVLCGRDEPQTAEGPSYDAILAQMEEERVNRRARRYLRDLRRDAVVDYR